MSLVTKFISERFSVWRKRKQSSTPLSTKTILPGASVQVRPEIKRGPLPAHKPRPRAGSDYASNM